MSDMPGVHLFDQHLYGYLDIEALHLMTKYGVFQALIESPFQTSEQLASALSLDSDVLERTLTFLAAKDILFNEHSNWCVNVTYSPWLNKKSGQYIGHFIQFIRNEGQQVLQQLEAMLVGIQVSKSPYPRLYADEFKEQTNFPQAMWELTLSTIEQLAPHLPVVTGSIVDLGGGSGALTFGWARYLQQQYKQQPLPEMTVFDLPGVADAFAHQQAIHNFPASIRFQPGDFFNDVLPVASNYVLSYVMSNWEDETCISLLTRIREQLHNDGQLVVLDRMFASDGVRPSGTAVMNLNMKLHTQGRHRRADEFRKLLTQAGFSQISIRYTDVDKQVIIASR